MEFATALGLDIAMVAIVLYCAHSAAKKGFVRTVIQMVTYIAVVLAASFFSRAAAPVIYDRIVAPMLLDGGQSQTEVHNAALVSMLPRGLADRASGGSSEDGEGETSPVDLIKGLLPDGLDASGLEEQLGDLGGELIGDLADAALRPLAISAISMIGFAVLFTLLSILANILLSTLGVINYLPVVGTLNGLLGGAIGVAEGLLLVWILAVLLRGMLFLHNGSWWIFTDRIVGDTFVFKYLYDVDLLRELIESL